MDNLNPAILGNIPVVIPPLTEQEQIKESIKSKIARFSELEEQANKAVELLGEHRSTLISSTVTGKIDVRDWEPPEIESEESDPAEALNG
jgi:type I restriction enzyme S subunit